MNRDDPGMLNALGRFGGSMFGMLQNRLELASIEIGEAGERLVFTLIASFAALLLFAGAVVALSAWIAAALWPALGHAVFGWMALAYALAGAGLLGWLRAKRRRDPPLLADTLAELHTDAAMMSGSTRPPRDAN